jgi:hypothetical protein
MAKDVDEASAPASQRPTRLRIFNMAHLEDVLLFGLFLLALVWLTLCIGSTLWLAHQVPLSAADLMHASWLGSYTTATYPSGVLGRALVSMWLAISIALAVSQSSIRPLAIALVLTTGMELAMSKEMMVQVGVANGSIKIGCYVYEARECREMLGVPARGAKSRYEPPSAQAKDFRDAQWYKQALGSQEISIFDVMPGGYFLRTPFLLGHTAELTAKLDKQRTEVARFQAQAQLWATPASP